MRRKEMYGAELCFFFQAEDGIRDIGVTGVQTCALPISGAAAAHLRADAPGAGEGHPLRRAARAAGGGERGAGGAERRVGAAHRSPRAGPPADRKSVVEGKSVDFGGRRIIKKKKIYTRGR